MPVTFSVVIPCYNAERWIDQALDSIAGQTLRPHEVIVVDDGSTDGSRDRTQAHAIVTHRLSSSNQGPAAARNIGIEAATGDWVAFLDADDWWQPTHLERVAALISRSEAVVYLAAAEHYSINVNRIVSMSDTGPFQRPTDDLDALTYFDLYLKHGILELSSMAIRRDRLLHIGGFDPDLRGAEDLDVVLSAIEAHTWAYDPIPSSLYRCNNPDSHSRKFATDPNCLTAKLRTYIKHQHAYSIPDNLLRAIARTTMSKAITECDAAARAQVSALVQPYLSASQALIFAVACRVPVAYELMNSLRQTLKGPQYRPRKEIPRA